METVELHSLVLNKRRLRRRYVALCGAIFLLTWIPMVVLASQPNSSPWILPLLLPLNAALLLLAPPLVLLRLRIRQLNQRLRVAYPLPRD